MKFVCQDCAKSCKTLAAVKGHYRLAHTAEGQDQGARGRQKMNAENRTPRWNKGLSIKTDERIRAQAAMVSKMFTGRKGHPHTAESREKLSIYAKTHGYGGYRAGSGHGKKGRYQGYWCDSSWELAWVIYQLEHGITFIRNWKKFPFEYGGRERAYVPDFYVPAERQYIEVKGYNPDPGLLRAKCAAPDAPVRVLDKGLMAPILLYVEQKYGKGFVRLYGL